MKDMKRNKDFEEFINKQPVDGNEKSAINELFQQLDDIEIPEPSKSMEANFYRKLEEYKSKNRTKTDRIFYWPDLKRLFRATNFVFKPAFAVIMFLIGIISGMLISNNHKENDRLISELQNTRESLMLTLLEQPSAVDRLKAVNLSGELESPDKTVIRGLLSTLNHDKNVNVRLAALEALFRYSNQPEVRKGLIEAIPNQESPMVLLTLSKAMVQLQEKGSVEQFRQILEENHLDENAKQLIKENIQKIS